MVLDYSKWDALELSDDSDIEVHPNVDKRSFIRAKQNQIHQQRYERRHHIETLKYEQIINDGLLKRIDTLLAALRGHEADARNPDDFMMQALMEVARDPADDQPPRPPEGVHSKSEQPRYSQMMASLVDQVKKEAQEFQSEQNWYKAYLKGVEGHQTKVIDLQKELLQKLNELQAEEARKITSDSIHTGFNTSSVSKEKAKPTPKKKAETVEVLNPESLEKNLPPSDSAPSSGAEADVDEPIGSNQNPDDEHIEPTALGREFAKIKMGAYQACRKFISEHREVVEERETDGLLIEAFNAQMDGKDDYAKQCVHQALLLQYCRSLGPNGVDVFFKRITTPNHQAQKIFLDDVNTTYTRISTRTAELASKPSRPSSPSGVEQIQLHAVDPDTQIHINVPQPGSTDPVEQAARAVFEQFPPGFQRALESSSLDRVNEVLGKMSVSEAEEIVERLGDSGMLSLEHGVIDGTTEEGRERLRDLEREARAEDASEGSEEVELFDGEPEAAHDHEAEATESSSVDRINQSLGDFTIGETNEAHDHSRDSNAEPKGQNASQASSGVEPLEGEARTGAHQNTQASRFPPDHRPNAQDPVGVADLD